MTECYRVCRYEPFHRLLVSRVRFPPLGNRRRLLPEPRIEVEGTRGLGRIFAGEDPPSPLTLCLQLLPTVTRLL